jgi:hypothetical protein
MDRSGLIGIFNRTTKNRALMQSAVFLNLVWIGA